MELEQNSLESSYDGTAYNSSLESSGPTQNLPQSGMNSSVPEAPLPPHRSSIFKFDRTAFLITGCAVMFILAFGVGGILLSARHAKNPTNSVRNQVNNYSVGKLSIENVQPNAELGVGQADHLSVNGQLKVSNTLVLSPTSTPTSPSAGQIDGAHRNPQSLG